MKTRTTPRGDCLLRVLLASVCFACSDSTANEDRLVPARLEVVSGAAQSGVVGAALPAPVAVRVSDATGRSVPGASVTFTPQTGSGTVAPSAVTTGADGAASTQWTLGTAAGTHTLNASVTGVSAVSLTATAVAGPAARVRTSRDSVRFTALQDTATLTATLQDNFGNPAAGTVTWSTTNPSIAAIDGGGRVTAVASGRAFIRATINTISDSIPVHVDQLAITAALTPDVVQFNALGRRTVLQLAARDRNGFAIARPAITWLSLDPQIASVDTAGTVTAIAVGTARIRAAAGIAADTATVNIVQVPAALSLAPAAAIIVVGGSANISAEVVDSAGAIIAGQAPGPLTYTSAQTAIATVNGSGFVTGVATGLAVIHAQSNTNSALRDSVVVAVAATNTIVASAIVPGSAGRASIGTGQSLALPVVLDLSRATTRGDLGAAELRLRFEPTVLQIDSVRMINGAVGNLIAPGEYAVAYAALDAIGSAAMTLATLFVSARGNAPAGAEARLELISPFAPFDSALNPYQLPLLITGRIRVR